jgi:hypothetical protein
MTTLPSAAMDLHDFVFHRVTQMFRLGSWRSSRTERHP